MLLFFDAFFRFRAWVAYPIVTDSGDFGQTSTSALPQVTVGVQYVE